MKTSLTQLISTKGLRLIPILVAAGSSVPIIYSFNGLRFEQLLFILILPFTISDKRKYNSPFFLMLASVIFYLIYFLTHVYTSFYLALCFTVFSLIPLIGYFPTRLSVFLSFLTAPAVKYLLSIFSFPVRLKLTQLAGTILSYIYQEIEIAGNCIYKCDIEFSVAEECLGLNMLTTGLGFSIFILAYFSKKFNKRPGYALLIITFLTSFCLITLANLSRIVLTVIFEALPYTFLHEFIGIATLVINVFIPLYILLALSKNLFTPPGEVQLKKSFINKIVYLLPILTLSSNLVQNNSLKPAIDNNSILIDGYKKSISKDGVLKFENGETLIYIKPPSFTLGSDHSPFICWTGSGYQIKNESYTNINHHQALSFELTQNNNRLYSYWWYSNGQTNTISQLDWRLATIRGEDPFYLINVTASTKKAALNASKMILNKGIKN